MKKTMKRLISLMLSIVMLLSVFVVVPNATETSLTTSQTGSTTQSSTGSLTSIEDIKDSSDLVKIYFKVETDKDFATYAAVEEITFTATLWADMDTDNTRYNDIQITAPYFNYTLDFEDGQEAESGSLDASSGTVVIKTSASSGGVSLTLKAANAEKTAYSDEGGDDPENTNFTSTKITNFAGGALVDASEHAITTTEPDGTGEFADYGTFIDFWESQLAALYNVDPTLSYIREVTGYKDGYTTYEFRVNCLPDSVTGNSYTSGMICIPNSRPAGTLGIDVRFNGYGVGKGSVSYNANAICVNILAHSIEAYSSDSTYYDQYNTDDSESVLYKYGFEYGKAGTNEDPTTSYFNKMLLRDVQAIRFLVQYFGAEGGTAYGSVDTSYWTGLWDGKTFSIRGSSQGGFQAIAVAALAARTSDINNVITAVYAGVPWMSDVAGSTDTNKINRGFRPTYTTGLAYYDTAIFAKYVTAPVVEITAGTGDTLCPISAVQAIYNNLTNESRSIIFTQGKGHSSTNTFPINSIQNSGHDGTAIGGYVYNLAIEKDNGKVISIATTNADGSVNKGTWAFDPKTGTLTLDATGQSDGIIKTNAHIGYNTIVPWEAYRTMIKTVVITDTVKQIGDGTGYALFANHTSLETVIIKSSSLTHQMQSMFLGCSNLTTIGPEGTPKGTFDLRSFIWVRGNGNCDSFFGGVGGGADITVLMPYVNKACFAYVWDGVIASPIDNNKSVQFSNANTVTFKYVEGNPAEEVADVYIAYNPDNFFKEEYTVEYFDVITSGTDYACNLFNSQNYYYSIFDWTLYSNGEIIFEYKDGKGSTKYFTNVNYVTGYTDKTFSSILNTQILDNTTTIGKYTTKITLKGFTHISGSWGGNPFKGWTALTTIDLGDVYGIAPYRLNGLFAGLTKLTTVGSSRTGYVITKGVVDLSCITEWYNSMGVYHLAMSENDEANNIGAFDGCTSVKKVILPSFYQLTNANGKTDTGIETYAGTFKNCTALEEVVVPIVHTPVVINSSAFEGCTSLKRVVFENNDDVTFDASFSLPSTVTEVVCYSETVKAKLQAAGVTATVTVETPPDKFLVKGTGSSARESYKTFFDYSFNTLTGELTITATSGLYDSAKAWVEGSSTVTESSYYVLSNSSLSGLSTFKTTYNNLVTSIKLVNFVEITGWYGATPLSGWNSLISIDLGTVTNLQKNGSGSGIQNNPKLTTIGSTSYGTFKEGVADLSTLTEYRYTSNATQFSNLLTNCSSITEVIMPACPITVDKDVEYDPHLIHADTFTGCTSLETIVIPEVKNSYVIADGAFESLTALKTIEIKDKDFRDTTDKVLPEKEGLKVICYSQGAADSLNANNYQITEIMYFGGFVTPTGFGIRVNKIGDEVNGLRTIYSFNTLRRDEYISNGYTFKEFGAILVSKNKLGDKIIELVKDGDNYVANISSAVKIPIYIGADQVGKILQDQDGNEATIEFAVTLANISASNLNSEIYTCGYAIFTDADGKEYIEYVNYGEINADYEYVSLAEVATNAYAAAAADPTDEIKATLLATQTDKSAVWNAIIANAIELDGTFREIKVNDDVYAMIAADTLIVRRKDGTAPLGGDLTAAQTAVTALGKTYIYTIGIKVTDTNTVTEGGVYAPSTDIAGRADGTLSIYTEDTTVSSYNVYWGNESGKLADYKVFNPIKAIGVETIYDFTSYTLIPQTADRLLIYIVDAEGTEATEPMVVMLPEGSNEYDLGEVLYEFQVMSDIHLSTDASAWVNKNFRLALEDIAKLSPNSIGLFINGDIADTGSDVAYGHGMDIIETTEGAPDVYFGMGNHDRGSYADLSFEAALERFLECTGNTVANGKPYFDIIKGNAHFIFTGPESIDGYFSEEQYIWLENLLAEDKAAGRRSYVFNHEPVKGIVAGAFEGQFTGGSLEQDGEYAKILIKYKDNVVLFSGHTHWELASSGTLYHYNNIFCTTFNTSAGAYTWNDAQEKLSSDEGYYFYVTENGIIARGRDFRTGKWIPEAQFIITY